MPDTAQIEANKAIARQFFERFDANDLDGVMALYAEDSTFMLPGRPEEIHSAGLYDKARMRGLFNRMIARLNGGLRMTAHKIFADGDAVIVEASSRGELTNGRVYQQRYLTLFRIADGKIREVREYNDTLHAHRIWFEAQESRMIQQNRDIIAAVFAETAKGNGRLFADTMADNMTWRTIGNGSWSGTFSGKETLIREIFAKLRERFAGPNTCIPSHIHANGDYVIVQANGCNRNKDGKDYCNDYCFVIRMENGKMAAIEEYCDTELVTSALGARV